MADAVGDRSMALVGVIADGRAYGARTLAFGNRDGLTIGQRHDKGAAGYRCGHACGVGNAAAFGDRWRGCQRHGRGVDGIGDLGHHRCAIDREIFKVTA
ncbi:hypothetical protein D3C76_1684760 [compost metagenome]